MSMEDKKSTLKCLKNSYWLCRIVYLRYLAFIYFVAFTIAFNQNEALIGTNGLTPYDVYMDRIRSYIPGSKWEQFLQMPTIYFFIAPITFNLNIVALLGMVLSGFVMLFGSANMIILALLWLLYLSLVNVGQTWYSFGWESQLLESGFLAIFLVPMLTLQRFSPTMPTPALVIWGNRWLLFRIMIGAGMIKLRGDACWRDLTCLNYHYQTQPVPNPLSPILHASPAIIHKAETLGNHIVELLLPWLLLVPYVRWVSLGGGLIQIVFQCMLIASGNLSFLNWLTILPALCTLDDAFLSPFFGAPAIEAAARAQVEWKNFRGMHLLSLSAPTSSKPWRTYLSKICVYTRWIVHAAVCALILYRSHPVVVNLMSRSQAMNTSYDPFRIVNTYGAFGSITKVRHEVILQGAVLDSHGQSVTNDKGQIVWTDYNFKCKPGDINRMPCVITPYHLRIDWLMWFAAFQSYQQCPWLVHLAVKILEKDKHVLALLSASNQEGDVGQRLANVTHVRAHLYEYKYAYGADASSMESDGSAPGDRPFQYLVTTILLCALCSIFVLFCYPLLGTKTDASVHLEKEWEVGTWWKRKEVREYMPPISLQDPSVRKFLGHHGWNKRHSVFPRVESD